MVCHIQLIFSVKLYGFRPLFLKFVLYINKSKVFINSFIARDTSVDFLVFKILRKCLKSSQKISVSAEINFPFQ
jgi:hypothetical protein